MSESAETSAAPAPGPDRAAPPGGYRRLVGAHRAPGAGHPQRGYVLTVALLAGTASMPILAAISAGSATVGGTALPNTSTPFIPTPSVGPVVVPLPSASQPAVGPMSTGARRPSVQRLLPAAPLRPVGPAPGSARRPYPPASPSGPDRVPTGSPPAVPRPARSAPAPAPGASSPAPATPGPTPASSEPTRTSRPSPVPLPSSPATSEPRPRPIPPAEPGRPPAATASVRPDPSPRRPAPPVVGSGAPVPLPVPAVALAEAYGWLAPWAPLEDDVLVIHLG